MTTIGTPTTVAECPSCGATRAERVATWRTRPDRTDYQLTRCLTCDHRWEREMADEELDDG